MLIEWMHYLSTTTASRGANQLGYARETAALEVRHRRCHKDWQAHIQSTSSALLAATPTACPAGTALMVGAGVARDLPLTELLARFERLILLDIAFSRPTRQLALSTHKRILCCHWDVTGVVDWLAQNRNLPPPSLFTRPRLPEGIPRPDWVASVNCLTQLPLLPLDWLCRHGVDENRLERFGRELIQSHLIWLRAWQVPICLISELDDHLFDADGLVVDSTDYRPWVSPFLESFVLLDRWTWPVHPPGELSSGHRETRTVEAWLHKA